MKKHKTTTSSSNQIRWVILLLAMAVILPTVCLLFFMIQAVKNDQLAFRQKLVDTYSVRVQTFFSEYPDLYWKLKKERLEDIKPVTGEKIRSITVLDKKLLSGMVVYDPNDNLLWPVVDSESAIPQDKDDEFQNAERLEFQDKNFEAAAKEYESISRKHKDNILSSPEWIKANISAARCCYKLGDIKKAIQSLSSVTQTNYEKINLEAGGLVSQARVFLAKLYIETSNEKTDDKIKQLIENTFYDHPQCSTEIKLWTMNSLIDIANKSTSSEEFKKYLELHDRDASWLTFSLAYLPEAKPLRETSGILVRLNTEEPVYGLNIRILQHKVIALIPGSEIKKFWDAAVEDIEDEIVFCRIYDDKGNFVAGTPQQDKSDDTNLKNLKFMSVVPGQNFDGWKAEFFFHAGIFLNAKKHRKMVYFWTTTLIILTMLAVTGLAGKEILRQAKLNTLKNDFIATITHELKTPLASMRVLVDTLLEGSYNDQKQAVEYLQLISKENKRLTGLIDNFLTFSRMERNKQAFEMANCSASEIAKDAAAAVRTKFNQKNCRFSVTIRDEAMSVYADKDAMVTVLVNLLDNAYKYSGEDKEIELSVRHDSENVCFAVTDNGIGMSQKVQKKVFERFYQADNKLSRTAEGCGLGLSIVKFIIDAHNGKIKIESEPGKGSTVRVWIS